MPAPPRAAPFASAPRAPGGRIRAPCALRVRVLRPRAPCARRSRFPAPFVLAPRASRVPRAPSALRADTRVSRPMPALPRRTLRVRAPRARRLHPHSLCPLHSRPAPRASYPVRSMLAFPAPLALAPPIVRARAPGFAPPSSAPFALALQASRSGAEGGLPPENRAQMALICGLVRYVARWGAGSRPGAPRNPRSRLRAKIRGAPCGSAYRTKPQISATPGRKSGSGGLGDRGKRPDSARAAPASTDASGHAASHAVRRLAGSRSAPRETTRRRAGIGSVKVGRNAGLLLHKDVIS